MLYFIIFMMYELCFYDYTYSDVNYNSKAVNTIHEYQEEKIQNSWKKCNKQ